jgi:RIO kinase 2
MKLDPSLVKFLDNDHWLVLTAIESGMRNHASVPVPLIDRIAGLRHGGMKKRLVTLLQYKLVAHENQQFDGYHLTYLGYDFLALHYLLQKKKVTAVGNQVGVGKEADIYVVANAEGKEMILKLHRLGRRSFTDVTQKRDYFRQPGKRRGASWLQLSRLAAIKEYAFMQALHEAGFNVPTPIAQTRHCVLMSIVPGYPLSNITKMAHPERVYQRCLDTLTRLAQHGLIHGDLNEYNIMVTENEEVYTIDFPQMTSTEHLNAQMYFDRDLTGIHKYFLRRFNVQYEYAPRLKDSAEVRKVTDLDAAVRASGWSGAQQQVMDRLVREQEGDDSGEEDEEEEDEENDEGAPCAAGDGPAPGEPGVGKADAVDGAEDLTDEEEEELTYEVAPERTALNNKGRGFFNPERWEPSLESDRLDAKGRRALQQAQRQQKGRQDAMAQAQSLLDGAAIPGDGEELQSLGQLDEDRVRHRVRQQLERELSKEIVGRAWRKNNAKGRQKIKERSHCKAALEMPTD